MKHRRLLSFILAIVFMTALPINSSFAVSPSDIIFAAAGTTSATVNMSPSAVVPDGIYYIKNKQLGGYLQVNDGDAPNYSTINEFMELHSFDGGDYQKWQITHTSDGYYKIANVKRWVRIMRYLGRCGS